MLEQIEMQTTIAWCVYFYRVQIQIVLQQVGTGVFPAAGAGYVGDGQGGVQRALLSTYLVSYNTKARHPFFSFLF